jgi:pimeloyl-ACP methyl ester carboxylesterase
LRSGEQVSRSPLPVTTCGSRTRSLCTPSRQVVAPTPPEASHLAAAPGLELPFDPLDVWRRWAETVDGKAMTCGHFLAEERPEEVADALRRFLSPT